MFTNKKSSKLFTNLVIFNFILLPIFLYLSSLNISNTVIYPIIDKNSIFRQFSKQANRNVVYGYLPWWQLDKIKYIQLDKLTDVAYFGLRINADGTIQKRLSDGTLEPGYNRWVESDSLRDFIKKAKKYNVRVSLTVISHIDDTSNSFLDCRDCWNTLANQVKSEMYRHNITDLNINFEYVGSTPKDKVNKYNEFVSFINNYMDTEFTDSFIVTSAFADSIKGNRITSNIKELSNVSDAIFIMGYDFHVPTSSRAGAVAPYFEIEKTVSEFLSLADADKLILGVPYYGYNWIVESDVLGASRIEGNEYIGYSASQTYSDVRETILENNSVVIYDENTKTPYFSYVNDNNITRQVHFENNKSLSEKYKLIKSNNLKGIGIWALGYDSGYTDLWDLLEREFWSIYR